MRTRSTTLFRGALCVLLGCSSPPPKPQPAPPKTSATSPRTPTTPPTPPAPSTPQPTLLSPAPNTTLTSSRFHLRLRSSTPSDVPVFVEELPLTRVRGELHRTLRLAEGTHRLPVHLGDDQPILTVQVTIDLSPPTLDVLTPRSGDACHDAQFTLNVAVDDTSWPVTLFVDDAPHRVDHPGEFTLTLPAPDQERWLAIRARDRWGHETPLHEVLVRPASSLDLALSRLVDDSGGVRDPNDPVGREALRACQRALDQQPPTFGWKRRASDLNRLTVAALGQRLGEPWASDEAAEARALAWGDPRVVSVLPRHGGWLSTHEFVGALLPRQLDRVCRRWLADTRAGLRSEGTGLSVPGSLRDVAPSWSEAAWRAWLRHHAPASLHEAIETRPLVWRGG